MDKPEPWLGQCEKGEPKYGQSRTANGIRVDLSKALWERESERPDYENKIKVRKAAVKITQNEMENNMGM